MGTPIHWFDIPIGPSTWSVVLSVPEVSSSLDEETHVNEGATECDESRIYINARMRRDRWPDILLHEILHAVIYVSGADKALRLNADREERLVSHLAPMLCDAMLRGGAFRIPRAPRIPREWRAKPLAKPSTDVEATMLKKGARK